MERGVVQMVSSDGIATITMDRPEAINALSQEVRAGVREAIVRSQCDQHVRVIVLAGAGEKGFCAGIDLKEAAVERERTQIGRTSALGPMKGLEKNLFETVLECGKPTIAALFGYTLGGGAELALACDIRFAARDLKFGFPEVEVGMGATFGCTLLPRLLPRGIAYEILYSGRRLDVDECARWGLVNRIEADAPATLKAAQVFGSSIAKNAPLTQQRYKAMINAGSDIPIAAALRLNEVPNPYGSADQQEGIQAWRDGRSARWTGQ